MSIKEWFEKQRYKYIGRLVNRKIQELVSTDDDIIAWRRGTTTNYSGNEFITYPTAVTAINNRYNGINNWGVLLTGNIIDMRAAFTVPAGLSIIKTVEEDVEREMEFAEEFLKYNRLDDDMPFELSKETEIEGKLCLQKFWDENYEWRSQGKKAKNKGMTKIRFLSWSTNHYTVHTSNDYMDFEKITYTESGAVKKEVTIDKEDFTYRRFGGRIDRPNEPAMKIWKCLTQIDFLDQALRDWREINRLFASPTPYFQTENMKDAKLLMDELEHMNWRIKKLLAGPAKFYFVQPDISGIEALEKEIITLAKMISATTGVPVHFLGLPDLMSNRATAENLMEVIWASTVKEREMWNSAYTEILRKAIDLYNMKQEGGKFLRNDVLRIEIQTVSAEQWQHLEKVLLPAYMTNAITLDYFLSQIPGLILEEEKKRREEEEKGELEDTKRELNEVMKENEEIQKNQFVEKEVKSAVSK